MSKTAQLENARMLAIRVVNEYRDEACDWTTVEAVAITALVEGYAQALADLKANRKGLPFAVSTLPITF